MRSNAFTFLLSVLLLGGCSPLSKRALTRTIAAEEKRLQNQIGVVVYDVEKRRSIFDYRSHHYFTPASNTKVLTLYAALCILGDSIPSIKYVERSDSVVFWGMGDPSFLYDECYNNFKLYNFLSNTKRPLAFSTTNFSTTHFGRGWAWDDYNDYYSTERSAFPIYGNIFSFYPLPDQTVITPKYFTRFYRRGESMAQPKLTRALHSNDFLFNPGSKFKSYKTPMRISDSLIISLLQDTLRRSVQISRQRIPTNAKVLYSVPVDSVYKVMMKESDNHIAEQLLLMCAGVISDTLKPEIAIRYMQSRFFKNYPDKPIWVDGSGLSRYNLFTPRFMVQLWNDILGKMDRDRLFSLLATGGEPGTLKNWFISEKPYVFGKTGTLSNNHSLSGYLVTKRGKLLVFSFMNANYTRPVNEVRSNMQRILNLYYENY
jgi:serine-type D-Ala-D-Ala carboxypeptidase/endopeptidase (penicillin-binding protein 4)